jgi:hypothetical protein
MKSLIKKASEIHGEGIFSNKKIRKGEVFYNIPLDFVFNEPKPRCAYIGKNNWVCDEEVLNYVNHSCNPNSRFDLETLSLLAIRAIAPEEEITVDYNLTENGNKKITCNCNNLNCRRYFLIRN